MSPRGPLEIRACCLEATASSPVQGGGGHEEGRKAERRDDGGPCRAMAHPCPVCGRGDDEVCQGARQARSLPQCTCKVDDELTRHPVALGSQDVCRRQHRHWERGTGHGHPNVVELAKSHPALRV